MLGRLGNRTTVSETEGKDGGEPDAADKVYVSQWHLSKLLNKYTGQNFSEILNRVRMEQAKKLLENPFLRIGDIAETVGFLDMAHFPRVFKKQVGVSANEYRNTVSVPQKMPPS